MTCGTSNRITAARFAGRDAARGAGLNWPLLPGLFVLRCILCHSLLTGTNKSKISSN
jgi:hypothetical protein